MNKRRCTALFVFFFNDTATTEIYTLPYTTLFRSLRGRCPPAGDKRRSSEDRPRGSRFLLRRRYQAARLGRGEGDHLRHELQEVLLKAPVIALKLLHRPHQRVAGTQTPGDRKSVV